MSWHSGANTAKTFFLLALFSALIVAVGAAEPEGWQQMSKDYFEFCQRSGMAVDYLVEPNANHYTMTEHLLNATRPLTQAMIKQLGIQ